jgi:hypothetical protein
MNASEVLFAAHLAFVPLLTSGQPVQTADTPTGHIERMAYMDNGVIR